MNVSTTRAMSSAEKRLSSPFRPIEIGHVDDRWEWRLTSAKSAIEICLQVSKIFCGKHVDRSAAERAAQLSWRIAIANKVEAELSELEGNEFAFQNIRLAERVVTPSAVGHLLRLDVPRVLNDAALLLHLTCAAAHVCYRNWNYRSKVALIRRNRRRVPEPVEWCDWHPPCR